MIQLSHDAFLGLKRHFLGVLSARPSVWVVPEAKPRLLFASDALRPAGQGCRVDFGTVETPGKERCSLRVTSLEPGTTTVRLINPNTWLEARWRQAGGDAVSLEETGAELELVVEHDFLEDRVLLGSLRLVAEVIAGESLVTEVSVRLTTRRTQPIGSYEFAGLAEPGPWDFGFVGAKTAEAEAPPAYDLSLRALTSVPLVVSFAELPGWLAFEVDGCRRRGPAAGRFFERAAPFQVAIQPVDGSRWVGPQRGQLLMRTNDARPAWQQVELEFSARFESSLPGDRALKPPATRFAGAPRPARPGFRREVVLALLSLFLLLLAGLLLSSRLLPG